MGKFIITEEDKKHIRGLYEQSTTGLTINQMLQGKEFPGLTKQEQGNIVYYSLLDGQKRKWFVSFRITPNNWIETKIVSTNPQFFEKVKSLYSSLKSFKDIGPSAGLDENVDLVGGIKQTSVNKDEIIKIFDTLVNQNKTESTTISPTSGASSGYSKSRTLPTGYGVEGDDM